jgi:probable rRNA maturation factor
MDSMKKHPLLTIDYHSTVKLTALEQRKIQEWLDVAGVVVGKLFAKSVIPAKVFKIQLSLLICGEDRIRKLNKTYRHKDKVTDVLSFPANENLRGAKKVAPALFLGDLAICHQQAKRQAKKFKISYMEEFIHLFFHGALHLLGYDHELSLKEEKLMLQWEEEALRIFSELKVKEKKGP